jgi:hypothetical protein
MTASSLHHRPVPFIAAAAAVVAIAAGSVALSISHQANAPVQQQPGTSVITPSTHPFLPTAGGGHLVGD